MANLATKIASLKLDNPTILASGLMDEDAGSMKRIIDCGAGAVVTKSIGLKSRDGYPNPTVIELETGFLNAMGLPNPGIKDFEEEVKKIKQSNCVLIGSVFGSNSKEFLELGSEMQSFGADALELNMSCPHAKGYGVEIGSDSKLVKEITSCVKDSIDIPVFVKLSSNVTDIKKIAMAAEKGNADGIVAINTVKAMKIDIDIKAPILANRYGGYSGKAIKPIGVRCVFEIAESLDIPIIGVGGITTGEDALEYVMAGASAVQIGTGIYYREIDIFNKVCQEMNMWMNDNNIKKISELIGVAHK